MNSNTTGLILIIAAPKSPVNKAPKIVNKLELHYLASTRSVAALRHEIETNSKIIFTLY